MMRPQTVASPRSVTKPPPYAWVILLVVYLASIVAALNQFKVPPVLPLLIPVCAIGSIGIRLTKVC